VTERSEEIGKKPHEADLSYTAVCTGSSKKISNGTKVREESEARETKGAGIPQAQKGDEGGR
jgi:hypothetical protein